MELNFEDIIDEGIVYKDSLTKKFWEGLEKKHGLTYEDIINEGWTYAGGDYDEHLNYLLKILKENINLTQPDKKKFCICGISIKRNAYIRNRNKTQMLVIGSCCIKRFMPEGKKGRTCGICETPHRNHKDNMCKECRDKLAPKGRTCEMCGKSHRNRKVNKCNECKDKCSKCKTQFKNNYGYEKCYDCRYIKECIKCKKEHNNRVDKCDHCCNRFKCGVCTDCGKKCSEKYERCYTCNQNKKYFKCERY